MTQASKSSQPSTYLKVPNAETWKAFQLNAKEVWRQAHPDQQKRPGRPSHESKIFDVLYTAEANEEIGEKVKLSELVCLVQKKLGLNPKSKKDLERGEAKKKEKAIQKYARIWLIINRKHPSKVTISDFRFLGTHYPKLSLAYKSLLEGMRNYGEKSNVKENGKTIPAWTISRPGVAKMVECLKSIQKEVQRFSPSKDTIKADKRLEKFRYPPLPFLFPASWFFQIKNPPQKTSTTLP